MVSKEMKKEKIECEDTNCPIHGSLSTRGRSFIGTVKSLKMKKTAVVSWERKFYFPKYERYGIKRSKVYAQLPSCIDLQVGDRVRIKECRPLSKTKKFAVIEKLENENNKSKSK